MKNTSHFVCFSKYSIRIKRLGPSLDRIQKNPVKKSVSLKNNAAKTEGLYEAFLENHTGTDFLTLQRKNMTHFVVFYL